MIFDTNKQRGNAGLSYAIAYFGCNGYTVSVPLNDTQDYDLVVDDCQRRCDFVVFRRTGNVEKWRVKVYSP